MRNLIAAMAVGGVGAVLAPRRGGGRYNAGVFNGGRQMGESAKAPLTRTHGPCMRAFLIFFAAIVAASPLPAQESITGHMTREQWMLHLAQLKEIATEVGLDNNAYCGEVVRELAASVRIEKEHWGGPIWKIQAVAPWKEILFERFKQNGTRH